MQIAKKIIMYRYLPIGGYIMKSGETKLINHRMWLEH